MSTIVVTPPAIAARVAEAKPSHSVRPGSLTCTWLSTRPGSSTSSSARVTAPGGDVVERGDGGDPAVLAVHGGGAAPVGQHAPGGRGRRGSCRHPHRRAGRQRGRGPHHPVQLGAPRRRHPAAGQGQPDGVLPGQDVGLVVRDVHRGCIGPRGHRWQPGRLHPARDRRWCAAAAGRRARSAVVPVQRPGSSPVRPSSTCSVAVSTPPSASSATSSARWWARAATTVGSSREVERAARRSAVIRCADGRGRAAGGQRDRRGHRPHGEARALLDDQRDLARRPHRAARTPSRPGGRVVGPVRRTASCPLARTTGSTVRPAGARPGDDLDPVLTSSAAPGPAPARAPSRPPTAAVGSSRSEIRSVGFPSAHRGGVAAHDVEVGADHRREVGLVDDEQVGGGHAGPALARHLVPAGDVDDEDLHVDEPVAEATRSGCRRRDSTRTSSSPGCRDSSSSTASRLAVMSSRIAVCGQQPVCTASIRSSGRTALRRRKSASSVV